MKYSSSILLVSASWASAALIQQCSTGDGLPVKADLTKDLNNRYCGAVNQILYENVSRSGSFKAITSMSSNGECRKEDKAYGGPMAPFNAGLSLHFRGPLHLKQIAVYNLASKTKRDELEQETEQKVEEETKASPKVASRHNRGHKHLHRAHVGKRADIVTATIDGKVVTWENNWFGGAPTDKPATPSAPAVQAGAGAAVHSNKKTGNDAKPKSKFVPSGSDWDRVAYYNAKDQTANNVMFMGNYGGQGSGAWSSTWGNSLAYLNAQGTGGSSSPQTLNDINIPSNKEFSVFSAEKCDSSCGFSLAPDVAYKGFSGASKIFLFEFKMPLDGKRCPDGGYSCPGLAPDMPAIWALNDAIPHAAQYNACSCWDSGCGEFDIFEVLSPGNKRCITAFHMDNDARSLDYFDRPVDKFIKVAAIFHGKSGSIAVKKLSDGVDFSKGLDDGTVLGWLNRPMDEVESKLSSLFQMPG